MGRPRQHNEETREALRAAAERLFEAHGPQGVSVRTVAQEVGTTTRAVYSLFGSGEGLLVDALASRAYEILEKGLDREPETRDPARDLVRCGVNVFRRFVVEHPAMFRIAFQRVIPHFQPGPELLAARQKARQRLAAKVARLEKAGLRLPVADATITFQAMCEGLGNLELRGVIMRLLPEQNEEAAWRSALDCAVRGLLEPSATPRANSRRR